MKDMVKTSYVRENIGDTEISSIYRKQLFQALDQSYQGLKGTKKFHSITELQVRFQC